MNISFDYLAFNMYKDAYDIEEILNGMGNDWYCTFLQRDSMDVGILRLAAGEMDPQSAHVNDEIYYIIRGDGFLRVEDKDIPVKENMVIFVPARKRHKFHSNTKELVALYVFAGKDEDVTDFD